MNENPQVQERTNLKTIYQSLSESESLLEDIEDKLNFTVNGTTPENSCDKQLASNGQITLDMISVKMYSIARRVSSISKHTNIIVGS